MYSRASRLFAVKFLGLWGGSNLNSQTKDGLVIKESERDGQNLSIHDKITSPNLSTAIEASNKQIRGLLLEHGVPGLTISVAKGDTILWQTAFGFCDVENQIPCSQDARMRIASISKTIFVTTIVAPMLENNKLKLDDSIYRFLDTKEFPKQKFNDKEYDLTVRQLLSHTSGISHYDDGKPEEHTLRPIGSKGSKKIHQSDDQYNRVGFYQRQTFRNVIDALEPFKSKPLVNEPGEFKYTTYGYTVLSAVAEKVHQSSDKTKQEQIEDFWIKVLNKDWKMNETKLDQDEVIMPSRARYYLRTGHNGALINAPYADNSVKWSGGGLISSTNDLVKFANAVISSYNNEPNALLKRETVETLWREVKNSYGLGYQVKILDAGTSKEKLVVYHSGGAVGASSVLVIYPKTGIIVAILTNMGFVNLEPLGFFIADRFEKSCSTM